MKILLNQLTTLITSFTPPVGRKLYVVENRGQMDQEIPPVSYPCALVKIDTCNWEDLNPKSRLGGVTFSVLLADNLPGGAIPPKQSESMRKLSLMDTAEALALLIEATTEPVNSHYFPNIDLISNREIESKKGIRQIMLTFTTNITRAKAQYTLQPSANRISVKLNKLPPRSFDGSFDRTFE